MLSFRLGLRCRAPGGLQSLYTYYKDVHSKIPNDTIGIAVPSAILPTWCTPKWILEVAAVHSAPVFLDIRDDVSFVVRAGGLSFDEKRVLGCLERAGITPDTGISPLALFKLFARTKPKPGAHVPRFRSVGPLQMKQNLKTLLRNLVTKERIFVIEGRIVPRRPSDSENISTVLATPPEENSKILATPPLVAELAYAPKARDDPLPDPLLTAVEEAHPVPPFPVEEEARANVGPVPTPLFYPNVCRFIPLAPEGIAFSAITAVPGVTDAWLRDMVGMYSSLVRLQGSGADERIVAVTTSSEGGFIALTPVIQTAPAHVPRGQRTHTSPRTLFEELIFPHIPGCTEAPIGIHTLSLRINWKWASKHLELQTTLSRFLMAFPQEVTKINDTVKRKAPSLAGQVQGFRPPSARFVVPPKAPSPRPVSPAPSPGTSPLKPHEVTNLKFFMECVLPMIPQAPESSVALDQLEVIYNNHRRKRHGNGVPKKLVMFLARFPEYVTVIKHGHGTQVSRVLQPEVPIATPVKITYVDSLSSLRIFTECVEMYIPKPPYWLEITVLETMCKSNAWTAANLGLNPGAMVPKVEEVLRKVPHAVCMKDGKAQLVEAAGTPAPPQQEMATPLPPLPDVNPHFLNVSPPSPARVATPREVLEAHIIPKIPPEGIPLNRLTNVVGWGTIAKKYMMSRKKNKRNLISFLTRFPERVSIGPQRLGTRVTIKK